MIQSNRKYAERKYVAHIEQDHDGDVRYKLEGDPTLVISGVLTLLNHCAEQCHICKDDIIRLWQEQNTSIADSMFKKLGYKKNFSDKFVERFERKSCSHWSQYIFSKEDKSILVARHNRQLGMERSKEIPLDQLKAIIKKCEELGWL